MFPVFGTAPLYYILTPAIKNNFLTWFLLGVCCLIHVVYLSHTKYYDRTYDVSGHLKHINYIATRAAIPQSAECWECYHPPIYYGVAAAVSVTLKAFGLNREENNLQAFSLLMFVGFLIATLQTFRLSIRGLLHQSVAAIFILFWPCTFIHAIRIGNDCALYLFHALAFLWLLKWEQSEKTSNLLIACMFADYALLTKANGIMVAATIYLVVLMRWHSTGLGNTSTRQSLVVSSIALALGVAAFLFVCWVKGWKLTNTDGLGQELAVPNTWRNFVVFDWHRFFSSCFIDPTQDATGRQYFVNFLLSSSLFGEFSFAGGYVCKLVPVIKTCLLVLLSYVITGFVLSVREKKHKAFSVSCVIMVLAIAFNRFKEPFACSGDFRYVLPLLCPMALFFSEALRFFWAGNMKLFSIMGIVVLLSFCVLNVMLIISVA